MEAGEFLPEDTHSDARGLLSSVELFKVTSISFKRYFVISDVVGGKRGGHAHMYTDQVLKLVQGKMGLYYENDKNSNKINLDNSKPPIFLPRMTWVEMSEISTNAIILVLSSDEYNIKNSIRNYDEFHSRINS